MDATYTGRIISERRKALGLTQKALAEQLHVTDKAVSKWERGMNFPDLGLMEALANALETTPAVLLGLENADQDEIVRNMAQVHEEQLTKQLRTAGWLGLLTAALLWVVYSSIAYQRTQAYQVLSFLLYALVIGSLWLLFRHGGIRKWNTGDWLCCYGVGIPIVIYCIGYLFLDHGFSDWVEISCILLSVASAQLLFYRTMQQTLPKALPVIGLTLYNLWYLANGNVNTMALICTAICFGVWLLLRGHDKHAQPLPVKKLTAGFLAGLLLFSFLFYDSLVKAYVNLRYDHLIEYCQSALTNPTSVDTHRYGPWRVRVDHKNKMVEFHTGGSGIGSETSYEGFYYSAVDAHLPFQGIDEPVEVYDQTGWWSDGTDNHGTTYRFRKFFYWFEAHF